MKILFLLFIINIILISVLILYFSKTKRLRYSNTKLKKDVEILVKTLQKVRYGQLTMKVENLSNKKLQNAVNRLIETLLDRESMIIEYQKNLSQKNLSLETMIEKEKESQKFKEDFIATLTHDFKTPVIAELNSIDLLLSGKLGDLTEKQVKALSLMKSSNKELMEMSEIVLETYKVQQTDLVLKKQKTDVAGLISEVVADMQPIALNNGVGIIFNYNQLCQYELDRFQMRRVLKNLILNALSYCLKSKPVTIQMKTTNNELQISIQNEGKGIPQKDIEQIFNKYYSSVKKYRKIGTGLGLYLSNQIILAHQGKIVVRSIPDEKTTFSIKLPIEQN